MSALSNDEKNQRIAEWKGWTCCGQVEGHQPHGLPPHRKIADYTTQQVLAGDVPLEDIPNYTGDLNAIAEAETHAIEKQPSPYAKREFEDMLDIRLGRLLHLKHPTFRATAEQRANALGITLGLWKEGE